MPAAEELAEPLRRLLAFRFSYISVLVLWLAFLCSGDSVDLDVKRHVSTVAPQCREPVLPGPV